MIIKIKFSALTALNNLQFLLAAIGIRQAFSTHAIDFPAPPIPIDTIFKDSVNLLGELTTKADSDDGSHNDRNQRDAQRETVTNMLITLGGYVLTIANTKSTYVEKKAVVEMAGYTVTKHAEPIALGHVENVRSEITGTQGEVRVIYDKTQGAKSYVIQTATSDPANPNTIWKDAKVTTLKKAVLTGLTPLTMVWCRVLAVGRNAELSAPSDPTMCIVL